MLTSTPSNDDRPDNTWDLKNLEECAQTVLKLNPSISSDSEETGALDLSSLTLTDLETLFERELGRSDNFQAAADCLSRRSTVSLYRAGRVLSAIKKKLKGERTWTKWQKDHKVSVTSAWQAIELFKKARSEKSVAGLSRTEALKKFDITKPKPATASKSGTTKCDQKAAPVAQPKLYAGDSQASEEQPTAAAAPQGASEPEILAVQPGTPDESASSQPETPDSTITPSMAMDYLHRINVTLEELERDLKGVTPDDHLLSLINQAIVILRRLRGDAATDIDAA